MGIINSVFGDIKNSVGNVTMYVRDGKNIMRQKPLPSVKEPTPKQAVQRLKFKILSDIFDPFIMLFNFHSIKANKLRTDFLSVNQKFVTVDKDTMDYEVAYDKLQVTSGILLPPNVDVSWNGNTGQVEIEVKWQPLSPIAQDEDDLFVMFEDFEGNSSFGSYLGKRGNRDKYSFKIETERDFLNDHVHIYVIAISANRKHSSKTAHVLLEKK